MKIAQITQKNSPEILNKNKYFTVVVVLTLVFIATTVIALQGVSSFEKSVFLFLNNWEGGFLVDSVARIFSDAVWLAVFVTAICMLFKKTLWGAWKVAVPAVSSYVFVFLAEHVIGRARPEVLMAGETVLRASQDGMGFPSGHAATVAAVVAVVWLYGCWKLRIAGALLVVLVCWSRVYLGVHFPLDVVTGVAVGIGAVACVRVLPQSIREKFLLA